MDLSPEMFFFSQMIKDRQPLLTLAKEAVEAVFCLCNMNLCYCQVRKNKKTRRHAVPSKKLFSA